MEIETDSGNESQLEAIRKPPLLLSQKESLAERLRNFLACLTKVKKDTKKKTLLKKFPHPNPLLFFHVLTSFFRSFKNKNNIISNSSVSSLISAK